MFYELSENRFILLHLQPENVELNFIVAYIGLCTVQELVIFASRLSLSVLLS